ncbi:sigma-70 family RNA polymerase sigma factor [Allorhizobium sp. BGMRC 0089]|uniref:sigma-70 family RNA polymerase sigma factor n=1 Tax=Allorhizobium sonneratiae TaxID=2934936 RepID=UPI00203336A1|nr:sigma-70 family RNA polymerase sigma factor [Allorhizobium sonneratiae]MCM2292374.1 sigma-70 family RNA polymerase sigma factor [Allorhizobium sonneratiae]
MSRFLNDVEACVPALRRYAQALTRDRDMADDLVQDCLERAIRKRALWRPIIGAVRPWLFRMLLNIYRNDIRQRRHKPAFVPMDNSVILEPHHQGEQYARLALAETAEAIDRLPDEQREALLLVVLEGVSYEEAAKILDVPIGTLMSRLGRARASLRILTDNPAPRLRTVK